MYRSFIKLIVKYVIGDFFLNYRLFRKKNPISIDESVFRINDENLFAIILQGPLIEESNFTMETLRLYKLYFPNAVLILSTWNLKKNVFDIIRSLKVHIIQNSKPENNGISNVNLQIITTRSGIKFAQKLGAKYVLKTRTDQRIYHPSLKDYLFSLSKAFPLKKKSGIQKERIIGISLNTFKFRLYGLSDHFLFGHIDDLNLYFDVKLDDRIISPNDLSSSINTWLEFSKYCMCEVYFCTNFLKKNGHILNYTLIDSFEAIRNHFLIIDQCAIKLYWHKYTLDYDRYNHYGFIEPEISFNDWLLLYNNTEMIQIDESILEKNIQVKI
jgi:hypothetical protein